MVKAPIIYKAIRDIEVEECNWLPEPVKKGEILYGYSGVTYGCISSNGLAVTRSKRGGPPFFEVPNNAIERIRF